jgi:hypothetical protein
MLRGNYLCFYKYYMLLDRHLKTGRVNVASVNMISSWPTGLKTTFSHFVLTASITVVLFRLSRFICSFCIVRLCKRAFYVWFVNPHQGLEKLLQGDKNVQNIIPSILSVSSRIIVITGLGHVSHRIIWEARVCAITDIRSPRKHH